MTVSFENRFRVPEDVLLSELDGEAVLLNLKSEMYFGLDVVGFRMWTAVTTAGSIHEAYQKLAHEYDVDHEQLREDLEDIVAKLVQNGLLEVVA